jgi:hypothetical protein
MISIACETHRGWLRKALILNAGLIRIEYLNATKFKWSHCRGGGGGVHHLFHTKHIFWNLRPSFFFWCRQSGMMYSVLESNFTKTLTARWLFSCFDLTSSGSLSVMWQRISFWFWAYWKISLGGSYSNLKQNLRSSLEPLGETKTRTQTMDCSKLELAFFENLFSTILISHFNLFQIKAKFDARQSWTQTWKSKQM